MTDVIGCRDRCLFDGEAALRYRSLLLKNRDAKIRKRLAATLTKSLLLRLRVFFCYWKWN